MTDKIKCTFLTSANKMVRVDVLQGQDSYKGEQ
jgi:hypothetical protein